MDEDSFSRTMKASFSTATKPHSSDNAVDRLKLLLGRLQGRIDESPRSETDESKRVPHAEPTQHPSTGDLSGMISQHKAFVSHLQSQADFYEAQLSRSVGGDTKEKEIGSFESDSLGGSERREESASSVGYRDGTSSGKCGNWIETLTIRKLKKEKADLVDLCSALQETLRRFRDREVESQKQLQKALEIVERGNAAQLDAEERAKQLEADVNVLEEKANENEAECNRMRTATEESKSTEINELRREMGDMERELAEARLKTERLDRQKGHLEQDIASLKEKAFVVEKQKEEAVGDLMEKLRRAEQERTDVWRLLQDEKSSCVKLKDGQHKMRIEIETKTWELEERARRAEKWGGECEEKCLALQDKLTQIEKQFIECKRSKDNVEYHSKLLAKEKRGLEKRLEDVELKINRVEDEAEGRCNDLKQVLDESKEETEKWKEQVTSVKETFHSSIKRLQQDARSTAQQLKNKTIQLQQEAAEYAEECSILRRQNHDLKQLLEETDQRAITSHKHVLSLMQRQKELLEDRQDLCRKLDHLTAAQQN
ncbi:serologically defined colon cancer antigen 8-like [Oscarella lobularis]|uniref:serologically defined colon cancer antigen 8-like n=1 Tax=Oscarella lobularis TaxID=121494 RepID=UPI0033130AD2